jgi:hypothetical protein
MLLPDHGVSISDTRIHATLSQELTAKPWVTFEKICMLKSLFLSVRISIVLLRDSGTNSVSVLGTEKKIGSVPSLLGSTMRGVLTVLNATDLQSRTYGSPS